MLTPAEKEALVRNTLSQMYPVLLEKKNLPSRIGRSDGSVKWLEFDLVSEDGKIVGEVKSQRYNHKARGNTLIPRAMLDCHRLGLVEAERKLMIFTDRAYYEAFREDSDGLIEGIEILLVEVPSDR